MTYTFVDISFLGEAKEVTGLPVPVSELPEEVRQKIREMGGDPQKLETVPMTQMSLGYLGDISQRVDDAFKELGYVPSNKLKRKVSDGFLVNHNVVYDTRKVGSIYVASQNPFAAHFLGVIIPPVNDEHIGMVKTEILDDSQTELIDRVRACYQVFSKTYRENGAISTREEKN